MTDVTQQLLSSVRKVLDMRRWGFGEHPYLEPHGDEALALHEMDEALTAYEASRAAPEFGPLDPRVHDLGKWEPARDDALEALRELSERATKGKAWHAIEGHVFSYIVDEHGVAEKHIAAASPSDATLIAECVNYVRAKLAAPAQEPR